MSSAQDQFFEILRLIFRKPTVDAVEPELCRVIVELNADERLEVARGLMNEESAGLESTIVPERSGLESTIAGPMSPSVDGSSFDAETVDRSRSTVRYPRIGSFEILDRRRLRLVVKRMTFP